MVVKRFCFCETCLDMVKKGKWDEIVELEVHDPEDMMDIFVEDLTWTQVYGDQVAVIPYSRFEYFLSGELSNKNPPTQFVVNKQRVKRVEDLTQLRIHTYLEYAM